jgi:hypothetical protein
MVHKSLRTLFFPRHYFINDNWFFFVHNLPAYILPKQLDYQHFRPASAGTLDLYYNSLIKPVFRFWFNAT